MVDLVVLLGVRRPCRLLVCVVSAVDGLKLLPATDDCVEELSKERILEWRNSVVLAMSDRIEDCGFCCFEYYSRRKAMGNGSMETLCNLGLSTYFCRVFRWFGFWHARVDAASTCGSAGVD